MPDDFVDLANKKASRLKSVYRDRANNQLKHRFPGVEESSMPFTFNGIGTSIYGARDFRPDGSYITTEWLVFVYIPVVPYRSMRILPNGKDTNVVVYRSSGYQILQKTGINLQQVLSVYGFSAVFIGSLWAGIALQIPWLCIPGVLVLFAPWLLHKRAVKKMVDDYKRANLATSAIPIE